MIMLNKVKNNFEVENQKFPPLKRKAKNILKNVTFNLDLN